MAVVLLGVTAVAGWRYYTYFIAHEWTDDAFIEGRIIQISPKVAGHVSQVYVTDNQEVRQGDLLLEIDPRDYTARLMQARAVLQAAMTKQQVAQSSVELVSVTSNAGIQQAAASVALAKSAVQTAHAQVVTARSRLDQARAQVDAALANAAQARGRGLPVKSWIGSLSLESSALARAVPQKSKEAVTAATSLSLAAVSGSSSTFGWATSPTLAQKK